MKKNPLINLFLCALAGTATGIASAEETATVQPLTTEEIAAMGAGADPARPFVINITGATLMENFIRSPASTNDFLDVDGDGNTVPNQLDNLANIRPSNPFNNFLWWVVQYRVVGSVNGYQELLDFGVNAAVNADTGDQTGATVVPNDVSVNPPLLSSDPCQLAYVNSELFISNGQPGGPASSIYNANNPGAVPVRSYANGSNPVGKRTYSAVTPFNSTTGGYRADIAPLDVPTSWANTVPGTTSATDQPFDPGYGLNPRLNVNPDGTTFVDPNGNNFGFQLVTVDPPFNSFNPNITPDEFTVFDTDFAYTPVAAITNHGVGYQTITFSRQRHMLTTGRTENGENLIQVTRDTGSGTHNAYANSFCIDPSHAVGEAIGGLSTAAQEQLAGPFFRPGNKGGSGGVEATARNARLAITYSGAERAVNSAWLTAGRLELLAVLDDIRGGTVAARPTIANVLGFQTIDLSGPPYDHVVLANRFNGYNIGGPGVLATIGDPRSELNIDSFGDPVVGVDLGNTNPELRNPQAAAYINNITRSTEAFVALGPDANLFTPGEFLAQTLIINGSRAFTQNRVAPCDLIRFDEIGGVAKNDALVAAIGSLNTLANPAYNTYGTSTGGLNGRTSTRFTVTGTNRYSDTLGDDPAGADDFRRFIRQDGTQVAYDNLDIRNRNRIAGDFNGDGLRNWNDALEMMRAYNDRATRPADRATFLATYTTHPTRWIAPGGTGAIAGAASGDAIIELLGDFNADGNFGRKWNDGTQAFEADKSDIRYWADGLALNPTNGRLNRMEGFTRVDTSWNTVTGSNNFFGTTLATPKAYAAGDSVGDVAGPSGLFTPNFQPIGHDGTVDAFDIDYVYAQFKRNPNVTDNALNWSNLSEAQFAVNSRGEVVGNLSADINGDLIIDQNDIIKLVTVILGTDLCDVNLDGVKDSADEAIILANLGNTNSGWATGDINGDGITDNADLDACFEQVPVCCIGNADKIVGAGPDVTFADITSVLGNFNTPANPDGSSVGDANCDGFINFADITAVLSSFNTDCTP